MREAEGPKPIAPSPRANRERKRDRIGRNRHFRSPRRTVAAGPLQPVQPVRRDRPSLIIERHLTRNRQRNPKRVRCGLPIAPDPGCRRPEDNHAAFPDGPLARQVECRTVRSVRELQHTLDVVESHEVPVSLRRQRFTRDTSRKRRMQRPQRDRINPGFAAFSC